MAKRKIIKIDEEKCTGCGECIPNCHEGALKIIDGKARLVSDSLCDGLGACLGYCPEGAITIEEREAGAFDEEKVKEHTAHHKHDSSCPGSKVMDFKGTSELRQWPIQIKLVPPFAPYLKDAKLLIAADCVPFTYADFHKDLLMGKVLLVGCPKLDDAEFYVEKITQILKNNNIESITCAHMEVPCCFGFMSIINQAIALSGKKVPLEEVTIGIKGERLK